MTRSDRALHHVVSRTPELELLRLSIQHWMDCPISYDNVESICWVSGLASHDADSHDDCQWLKRYSVGGNRHSQRGCKVEGHQFSGEGGAC